MLGLLSRCESLVQAMTINYSCHTEEDLAKIRLNLTWVWGFTV